MPRLVDQMREALAMFSVCGTVPALIGGLALAAHNVVRATQDIDFLADRDDAQALHEAIQALGYQCVHRSDDAANYLRGDEGLDLLYAHRPAARQLLDTAQVVETPMGQLRVVSAEGLIGFKLQGYVNPVVLAAAGGQPYVRRPTPSPMQSWMDLMELVEMLCPRWPIRTVVRGTRYLL